MKSGAPLLIVLSAPSGAGKTTLCKELLDIRPRTRRAITCTTRAPRPGEREGIDYYFLTEDVFREKCAHGDFLEWATVHGRSYGTLKSEVLAILRAGDDALLNIDVQGAASIRQLSANDPALSRALVTVFLTPPQFSVLEARLRKRGTESEEAISQRLAEARNEMTRWREFDFVILSGSIQEDLHQMLAIIDSERVRTRRIDALPFEQA